ncbi:MAG: tetratricopeptide repeat protein [Proteobacteria bacterium]|nr:tetratricopeptide repeat protein [Pseudomonadota bacterium]
MKATLLIAALFLFFAVPTAPVALAAGDPPTAAPSDPDYDAGKKAIESKNWKSALDYFGRAAARDPGNADIHNYLGYAYRKSGNLDAAFKSYAEALRLDPKHKGAHEYVGEAYLLVNNLSKAEEHLAALDKICFFSCEEYRDLKKDIEEYKKRPAKK